jgi:hypothetical protein
MNIGLKALKYKGKAGKQARFASVTRKLPERLANPFFLW